ncbi:hypothetical protein NIIDNTM18_21030 [Mycolicibacterium litorale]|uniref:Uncharacterized protein n=1 Tax=Mycolicibacterium litorale TaxID=758802 RepID=A0A6S6P2Z4_9MYCO|nr:hypothetical protein [Mycolicibacterium litorale]BCI52825.1 hypothetical protein NIIDNTM18_21030 [Mycolicibacterium litorale]
MLAAIALVPSPPVLVPELAGGAADELTDLRTAVGRCVAGLPDRWVAIGVAASDEVLTPPLMGTYAGYGVDVRVALSAETPSPQAPGDVPLCALATGWIRGRFAPHAAAEVRVFSTGHDADTAVRHGRALRTVIDDADHDIGLLVVADGCHTLTPSAPGGYDPDAVPVQVALDDALAAGDAAALARLPGSVVGRVAYQVLAGLTEPAPSAAEEFYRGAPYGVGYFAGRWTP